MPNSTIPPSYTDSIVPFPRRGAWPEREPLRDDTEEVLPGGGGGGTSGGMSDDWKNNVDTQMARLHTDLRQLTGWLIAGLIAPMLAIIGLYVYIGSQSTAVEARIVSVEKAIADVRIEQAKTNGKLDLLLERKQIALK